MITRRHLLQGAAAAVCAAATPALTSLCAAQQKRAAAAGKDYIIVRPPVDYPERPILVHNFFAYTCPHCLTFEPVIDAFAEELKSMSDVKFVASPVAWNTDLDIFSSVYYSLEAMNRLGDIHLPFWNWVIREDHAGWTSTEAIARDIEAFMGRNGIKSDDWNKMLKSFSVVSKTRQAARTWKHYGVDSTPSIGIAGRFITAPHLVGTREGAIDMARELIARIRREK